MIKKLGMLFIILTSARVEASQLLRVIRGGVRVFSTTTPKLSPKGVKYPLLDTFIKEGKLDHNDFNFNTYNDKTPRDIALRHVSDLNRYVERYQNGPTSWENWHEHIENTVKIVQSEGDYLMGMIKKYPDNNEYKMRLKLYFVLMAPLKDKIRIDAQKLGGNHYDPFVSHANEVAFDNLEANLLLDTFIREGDISVQDDLSFKTYTGQTPRDKAIEYIHELKEYAEKYEKISHPTHDDIEETVNKIQSEGDWLMDFLKKYPDNNEYKMRLKLYFVLMAPLKDKIRTDAQKLGGDQYDPFVSRVNNQAFNNVEANLLLDTFIREGDISVQEDFSFKTYTGQTPRDKAIDYILELEKYLIKYEAKPSWWHTKQTHKENVLESVRKEGDWLMDMIKKYPDQKKYAMKLKLFNQFKAFLIERIEEQEKR